MARLLPLFPLQLVVFPGSAVPLHIFEDRYKEMVGEAETAEVWNSALCWPGMAG